MVLLEVENQAFAHLLAVALEPTELVTGTPESWTGVSAVMVGVSPSSSVENLARTRSEHPELPLIALLEEPTPSEWRRVFLAGANSAIDLDSEPAAIVDAIRFSLRGYVLVRYPTMARLIADSEPTSASPLDQQEATTLRLLASGISISRIAQDLNYSERHLRRILRGIYAKLGTTSKSAALIEAAHRGII